MSRIDSSKTRVSNHAASSLWGLGIEPLFFVYRRLSRKRSSQETPDRAEDPMIELIAAGALGVVGHLKSKDFVKRRLRFTSLVERPGVGLMAGAAAALVAAPVVAILRTAKTPSTLVANWR